MVDVGASAGAFMSEQEWADRFTALAAKMDGLLQGNFNGSE